MVNELEEFSMQMLLLGWSRDLRADNEMVFWRKDTDMIHVHIGVSEMLGGTQYFGHTYIHNVDDVETRKFTRLHNFYQLLGTVTHYDI